MPGPEALAPISQEETRVATARSSQSHQKRVQEIADDAADKIAADAPLEEEVVVMVEELPPGESARSVDGRNATAARDTGGLLTASGGLFDPRRLTEESFRWAEQLLAAQKHFALKIAEAMTPAKV
jgi:glycine/D-amino acid oxidase-like deaminating enzyme